LLQRTEKFLDQLTLLFYTAKITTHSSKPQIQVFTTMTYVGPDVFSLLSQIDHLTAIRLGIQWQNESIQVRAMYKARADKLKLEHALMYPGYSYQPRKSSERKRRMSKKKAAALALANLVPNYGHLFETPAPPAADFTQLSGSWTTERQGTLPASEDLISLVDKHNRAQNGDRVAIPLALQEFGPSQDLMDAQAFDLSQIDWNAMMAEIGFPADGNPTDQLIADTVSPGSYLY
jgi:hypothetical protein